MFLSLGVLAAITLALGIQLLVRLGGASREQIAANERNVGEEPADIGVSEDEIEEGAEMFESYNRAQLEE